MTKSIKDKLEESIIGKPFHRKEGGQLYVIPTKIEFRGRGDENFIVVDLYHKSDNSKFDSFILLQNQYLENYVEYTPRKAPLAPSQPLCTLEPKPDILYPGCRDVVDAPSQPKCIEERGPWTDIIPKDSPARGAIQNGQPSERCAEDPSKEFFNRYFS
jgi:hypothetical protein